MATLYLNEGLHPDAFRVGARLPLRGADARHASQVARVRTGERIGIGDGAGRIGWGPVVHVAQTDVAIEVDDVTLAASRAPRLVLVQALAKGDRDELAIQAATELGVDEIVPWQAARSVSRWEGPKVAKGLERWRSVVREASKQAIRPVVPAVAQPVDTKGLIAWVGALRLAPLVQAPDAAASSQSERSESKGIALVLEPTSANPLTAIAEELASADVVALIVGPEGGVAPEELVQLDAAGARPIRLGPEVLRTSTAGPAAIAALAPALGRW